ncbi:IS3 family transposase [Spiroplasma endosymbiont of Poecilobothrus nobilitatus]|uniref:IS3 family transposase n=1 Tax=Spiroplasma endosymbiont of Poecilobothrus nobilitatus TaxID=1209220 RepID=UPI00313A7636
MSRRGSSPDNGHTESWFGFGTFKTEFFETLKRIFRNKEYIYKMIPQYIKFYNEIRPQRKLKWLSPVEYRITQS